MSEDIAKPSPSELLTISVVMQITCPSCVISGPPALPEIIGALICMRKKRK